MVASGPHAEIPSASLPALVLAGAVLWAIVAVLAWGDFAIEGRAVRLISACVFTCGALFWVGVHLADRNRPYHVPLAPTTIRHLMVGKLEPCHGGRSNLTYYRQVPIGQLG